jgi:hypothetical protein
MEKITKASSHTGVNFKAFSYLVSLSMKLQRGSLLFYLPPFAASLARTSGVATLCLEAGRELALEAGQLMLFPSDSRNTVMFGSGLVSTHLFCSVKF